MIVLVGSQKGGTGKTTIATNLATEWARQGRDVCLVDADPQRNAARWHADRLEAGHSPSFACVEKQGDIRRTLLDLDERYDLIVVDVAGKDSTEMRTAMLAADALIVPSRPSQFDLDTLEHLSGVVDAAQDMRPDLKAYGLLSQVPTNFHSGEGKDGSTILGEYPQFTPLRATIHERAAYRHVLSEGLSVVEWTDARAKAEIQVLAQEVLPR